MKKYLIYAVVALGLALFLAVNRCARLKEDRNRLSDNQRSLLSEVEHYKFRDSLNAASIERLTLTAKEFGSYFPELKQDVKDLGIKVKRVESIAQTATESKYPIVTVVKDSLIYRRDTVEKWVALKCIDFKNPYIRLSGCEENGLFKGDIRTVDTLLQVVHRVPKKFWFIRWGTKAIRQEVVSRNPYSSITYAEYLELKR